LESGAGPRFGFQFALDLRSALKPKATTSRRTPKRRGTKMRLHACISLGFFPAAPHPATAPKSQPQRHLRLGPRAIAIMRLCTGAATHAYSTVEFRSKTAIQTGSGTKLPPRPPRVSSHNQLAKDRPDHPPIVLIRPLLSTRSQQIVVPPAPTYHRLWLGRNDTVDGCAPMPKARRADKK
jgi:hypothetical protein